ncbi:MULTISPECIES: SDR family NAD(P)-dependent oxidoreductase [Acidithrix]|uniref:3-oxoacyl-[acyl-carrier-protein] reductase FabG n=1 Tax=Acidithrix ferrooxidans TaxID=1280514 RepID=A0A0D8HLZ7_9ACTN|nr:MULTISPECIES: SDR family NAD(P)-dependent oxidoreductase [Acidithrix]KJF18126.1 3-oxoacyl-[acyl-carrier-protein] reductase FabG [Acidithrix ferrooxidans]CAG4930382.1 unnamed protein product [Acidithrix sp. C25]
MDLGLKGKVALISGGTKGIGRAIAVGFAKEGANVAFCARNPSEVAETQTLLNSLGVRAMGTTLDIGNAQGVADWVEASASELGGLDIVINNVSALAIPDSEENWKLSLEVDLMGTVRICKASLPHLIARGEGSIVNISSVSGREADFAGGPYGTVKSAIIAYSAHLAFTYADKNIRANTVSPGNTYFPGGVWENIENGNPQLFDMAMALNPTGRMGTPQESANAVIFLSSPAASRISGTNLVVDGALTRGIQF